MSSSIVSGAASSKTPIEARVARDFDEVAELRDSWGRFSWPRVDADLDFFTTLARTSPKVVRPHVILLEDERGPQAMAVARLEETALPASLGYKTLYRPRLRLLVVAHGGITAADSPELSRALIDEIQSALRRDEADAALMPAVRTSSALFEAARGVSWLSRQHVVSTSTHWTLELPESMEAFLKSRSKKARENARVYRNRLRREFGDRLTVEVLRTPEEIDRIFADLSAVAERTYQSGLGVAFADSAIRRDLVALALERGWFRAYVMYLDGEPIAFWPGHAYARTFYVGTPGYDPRFGDYSIGTILLLRVIEDLCTDPAIDVLDYGFGDADYKRRFGTTTWEEADVLVFARRFRGARINLIRSVILAVDRAARTAAERTGVVASVKKRWRRRLQQPS